MVVALDFISVLSRACCSVAVAFIVDAASNPANPRIFNFIHFLVEKNFNMGYHLQCFNGHMAELVDALVSGTSGSDTLEVRVFLCPPYVKEFMGL